MTSGSRTVGFTASIALAGHASSGAPARQPIFAAPSALRPPANTAGTTNPECLIDLADHVELRQHGGGAILTSPDGRYTDVLVYENGDTSAAGWQGPAVYPYKPSTNFGEEGQILYRKLDQRTGLPVPDTDGRADSDSDPADIINGRQGAVSRLGSGAILRAARRHGNAPLEISSRRTILMRRSRRSWKAHCQHPFRGLHVQQRAAGRILMARARAGVQVEMILEGSPPGGISEQQRWIVQQLVQAGGRAYYFRSNAAAGIYDRYTYQHGKFWVLDGDTA